MLKNNKIENTSVIKERMINEKTDVFNEYLTSIKENGFKDGLINKEINFASIISSVRMITNDMFEGIKAKYGFLKDKLTSLESEKKRILSKIEILEPELKEKQKSLQLLNGLLYTFAGIAFLLGDIEFSRQTVIKAWNMGNDSWVAQISLIMGIAMSTVFIKLVYQRFVEPKFEEKRKKQDKPVTVLYFFFAGLFIFFFAYLGFVRSIIHQISMRTNIDIDLYDYLAQYYPYMNIIAFIGIAIMFLIGGAVLLTVGMNEFKKYSNYYQLKKMNKVFHSKLETIEIIYDDYKEQYHVVKEKYDSLQKNNFLKKYMEDQYAFFADMYYSGYIDGKKESERLNNKLNKQYFESLPHKNFHNAVRSVLDNQMINNNGLKEVINNV